MDWNDVAITKKYIDAEPNVKSNIRAQYFKDFIEPRKDFPTWDAEASERIRSSFVDTPKEEKSSIVTAIGDKLKGGRDFLNQVGTVAGDFYEQKKYGPEGAPEQQLISDTKAGKAIGGAVRAVGKDIAANYKRLEQISPAFKLFPIQRAVTAVGVSAVEGISKAISKPATLAKSLIFFGKYRTVEEHLKAFKKPSDFPSTSSIIRENYKTRNLTRAFFGLPPVPEGEKPLTETEIKVGSEILGGIADVGVIHLGFAGAGAVAKIPGKIKGAFRAKQAVPRNQMIDLAESAARKAGFSATDAKDLAETAMKQKWSKSNFFQKTPGNIRKGVEYMQKNEDILVASFKQMREALQTARGAKTAQAAWMRKAGVTQDLLTTPKVNMIQGKAATRPNTHFGKLIEGQMLKAEGIPLHPATAGKAAVEDMARQVAEVTPALIGEAQPSTMFGNLIKAQVIVKEGIPLHPAAAGKEALANISKQPISSKFELTSPKLMSQIADAEVVASSSELSPNVIPEMDDLYNVEYITASGIKEDMMSGAQVHKLAMGLRNGVPMKDAQGLPVSKVRSFWSLKKKAHLNMMPFEDAITDIHGVVEKNMGKFSTFAKKLGTPFWIGQKYPNFKPVYNGVQGGVDYKTELFYEGAQILQPKNLGKLPVASKNKIASVIRHGNTTGIEKWFSPEELTRDFGMSPEEITSYNRIRKMYKFATDIEVKSRKTISGYDKMNVAQKASADERIKAQVGRLGGYVSQSRSGGDWAVYSPPKIEGDPAEFFNLYPSKSTAQAAAKDLGPESSVYLRNNISRDQIRHLTLADLENLIEAADVSTGSSDIAALRNVLKSRTFSSHWIKRKNVPGFNWEFDSIVENAIDYMEGSASKLGRITGKQNAEAAFARNVGSMTPDIRSYARNFIDVSYNSGAVGYQTLNKVIYGYKLAFKTSWLAQNLTQPFATTYPLMSRYYAGFNVDSEKAFIGAYGKAMKYAKKKVTGDPHGLDPRLNFTLEKLHKQGVLGDQLTKFQLGVKKLSTTDFEKWMGLYGRIGEGINRSQAAIVGYDIATNKLGYTNKDAIINFAKEFVLKTQFPYGKQNLPQVITGAGNLKNVIRTMYTFKHFSVNHMQMMNSVMPWRGGLPGEWSRALGSLVLQGGIKALPFAGLFALGYKMLMGRTMDSDIRGALAEAEVPNAAIDMALHGMYSQVGIDASGLIGAGDIIPTIGTTAEKVAGPAAGLARQLGTAAWYASRGEHGRALENASPDAIRNVFKGARYATEGLRKASGELISTPSKKDAIMQGIGFTPLSVSKAWSAREAIKTMVDSQRKKSSEFHQAIAKALNAKDKKKQAYIEAEVRRYNSRVPREARVELKRDTVNLWREKMSGRDRTIPRRMRNKARELETLYGVRRGIKR